MDPTETTLDDEVESKDETRRPSDEEEKTEKGEFILEEHRHFPNSIGYLGAFAHLAKTALGTGILAIPQAFSLVGIVNGVIWLLIFGTLSCYCHYILAVSTQTLCIRSRIASLEYGKVAELCLKLGPSRFQKYSKVFLILVEVFIILSKIGTCAIYIVFIADNIKQFIDFNTDSDIDSRFYMAILGVLLVFISFIRYLSRLSMISLAAIVCQTIGIIITFYFIFRDLPHIKERPAFIWKVEKVPVFLGTTIFSVQGITGLNSVEVKMRNPRLFVMFPWGVIFTALSLVVIYTAAIGFFGFWSFEYPQGSITLNLPIEDPLAQFVKFIYALGIFLSYPIHFYILFTIMCKQLVNREPNRKELTRELLVRAAIVIFTALLAIAIPFLSSLISIVGAVTFSTLTYIFPPFIFMMTFWGRLDYKPWIIIVIHIKDIVLIIIGIIFFFISSIASIANFVRVVIKK